MLANITIPSEQQILLFKAVNREMEKRTKDSMCDEARYMIVSNFVNNYDFSNSALAHKSAGGWADMLISELGDSING